MYVCIYVCMNVCTCIYVHMCYTCVCIYVIDSPSNSSETNYKWAQD